MWMLLNIDKGDFSIPDHFPLLRGKSVLIFYRVVSTFTPMQNSTGGFGGGHGQFSHIATSYATVLSLVMVGGEEALELVDRKAM